MRPDLLVLVELGRVRLQEEQLQLAALDFDVLTHQLGLVHGVTIDHHNKTGFVAPTIRRCSKVLKTGAVMVPSCSMKRNSPL